MTPAKYQLTATRGEDEVLRQGFGDREEADEAVAEALARYHDCEVRLISGDGVLISAGPAPSRMIPAGTLGRGQGSQAL